MSRHPITPMSESDIRRHLAQQTDKSIGLVDTLQMQEPAETRDCGPEGDPVRATRWCSWIPSGRRNSL